MTQIIKHGWFSEKAARMYGTTYWSTESGEDVQTTAVYETKEEGQENYKWADGEYVGPVLNFKLDARLGSRGRTREDSL